MGNLITVSPHKSDRLMLVIMFFLKSTACQASHDSLVAHDRKDANYHFHRSS
jgi:hypothetical protein